MAQVSNAKKLGVFTGIALLASTLAIMYVVMPTQASAAVISCGGWYWNGNCCDGSPWNHKERIRQCSDGSVQTQCSLWSTCS